MKTPTPAHHLTPAPRSPSDPDAPLESQVLIRLPAEPRRSIQAALARTAGRARILALACGSCADWGPALTDLKGFKGEIALNDCDAAALAEAERRISPFAGACRMLQGNAARVTKRMEDDVPFDLVLVGDFFDYLDDATVVWFLRSIHGRVLARHGILVWSCIAADAGDTEGAAFASDWGLTERSEERVLQLCAHAGIPRDSVEIERSRTQPTLLVRVVKG